MTSNPKRIYTHDYCEAIQSGIEPTMAHDLAVHAVREFHRKDAAERLLDTDPKRWQQFR